MKFKKMIVEALNYYKLNNRKIKFQFIPKEYIVEFKINEDENDHRVLHISLTDKSKEVVGKVIKVYEECKDIMQKNISAEELETVRQVITKINQNINEELGE